MSDFNGNYDLMLDRESGYYDEEEHTMTKQDAIDKLDALDSGDAEMEHCNADDILLDYLRDNGAPEVADAFSRARERVSFWYA